MRAGGDPRRFIADNLPLAPARAVPEVRLHLAHPASGLWRLEGRLPPYWAYQWAGGTALARFILDRPQSVAGLRVLDLGCGGGIVAIAAAMAGAREVEAIDIDPLAIAATQLNAAANDVALSARVADILDQPPPAVDLLLAGDVFYDAGLALRVTDFLDRCRCGGNATLVGDPRRAPLPLARLRLVAEVPVPDFAGAHNAMTPSAVFAFE